MTSVLVTALGNQLKAFASDFGDDQSRYLCNQQACYKVIPGDDYNWALFTIELRRAT